MNRYDSYKDSRVEWIGDIPQHWENLNLGNIFTVSGRIGWKNLRSDEYVDEPNYIFLSTPNLKGKEIDFVNVNYITKERYDESPEIMLELDDILLVKSGSTLGIVNIIRDLPKPTTVNGSSVVLKKRNESDLGSFYNYLMGSNYFQNLMKITQGGVGVPSVNQSDIRKFKLLKPPFSEQQQIVSFLNTKTSLIDSLIEKTQRKIELLKEKRTSLINELVTKGLNPNVDMKDSGVEWIGEIPSHWVLSKVMYVLEFHNNIRIPLSSEDRGKRQGEYRYYGSTGIIDYIDDYLFDGEYILIGEDGSNLRLRTYRLSNVVSGKFWVNNHSHILRSKDGNNHYYSHLLELTDFSNYITGSTQPKLTMDNLKIVPMISPPLNEQKHIIKYLDEQTGLIDKTISIEEKRIELLKEYRQSLISEVVTGKRKVTTDE